MFQIQGKGKYGDWDPDYVSNDPAATNFTDEIAAYDAIPQIRAIGPEWADREYRVVEIHEGAITDF